MARQQAADYEQKREIITKQAADLFAAKGFDGASISDIAAACNTSKSLIYHYYPSKEAILFDVMNGHIDLLTAIVDEVSTRNSPPDALFRELARELMQRYMGAASHQKVLLYELDNLPADERLEIVRKQRKIIAFTESLLAAAAPAPVDAAQLRVRAMLFFGMLNWTHTWFNPAGPVNRDAIADMAAQTTLDALKSD
ncbi:MAG: TetR/AcrR family transcriptional regulator [Pseudomonadota bacterium]